MLVAVGEPVGCVLEAPGSPDDAVFGWTLGDGATATGAAVEHAYSEPGAYQLAATVTGNDPTCADGAWATSTTQVPVAVCDVPSASFQVQRIDGLTYQLLNETPIDASGCIEAVQWDLFADGDDQPIASFTSWEPEITLPQPGSYRVLLHVGGPFGTSAAELDLDATAGCGCQTTRAPAGWLLAFGLVALGIRRRTVTHRTVMRRLDPHPAAITGSRR